VGNVILKDKFLRLFGICSDKEPGFGKEGKEKIILSGRGR